ncbi:MAG TPA: hypothetical protein VLW52_08825 [Opitutaceae bacterium]|nr:hypothetical protein [Opitutaceae bacterium]
MNRLRSGGECGRTEATGAQIEMGTTYHGRVRRTEDVVKVGDMVWVKCIGIDDRTGNVRLARRAAMKEREATPAAAPEAAAAPATQQ